MSEPPREQSSATALLRATTSAIAACLVLAAPPAGATTAPSPPSPLVESLPEFTNLDEFDTLLQARDRMVWSVRNEPGDPVFGKPLADYANQYVLTPAAEARLRELRSRAAAQSANGARAELTETLRQARAAMELEVNRVSVLYAHRTLSSNMATHEAALKGFMEKAPVAEQQRTRARLDTMLEQARRDLDDMLQLPTMDELLQAVARDPVSSLPRAYNEERMRLAPFAAAWDREHGVTPMNRKRSKPCSPPHPSPSTTGRPQLVQASVTDPDYPPDAQRMGFEGVVHVRADISPEGCADRMEVARSSGLDSLDAAALQWAEGVRFHPAQSGGETQAASHTFGVTFKLAE